jgi:hypothetical protein
MFGLLNTSMASRLLAESATSGALPIRAPSISLATGGSSRALLTLAPTGALATRTPPVMNAP